MSNLRPFFTFYGGKWRDTPKRYPPPAHDTIIEPFAGSAGYSVRYPDRKVILCDLDPVIVGIWSYLIRVSESEILSIPDVHEHVDELDVCQEAKWLVGFWLHRSDAYPGKHVSTWMKNWDQQTISFWGVGARERIAAQLSSIRHWEVRHCGWWENENQAATWFVDPPYVDGGEHYKCGSNNIDYEALGLWCKSRDGMVIACESGGAWLPFADSDVIHTGNKKRRAEAVWIGKSPALEGEWGGRGEQLSFSMAEMRGTGAWRNW